jgi:hypothetical protein
MWKETIVTQFEVLSRYLLGEAEKPERQLAIIGGLRA